MKKTKIVILTVILTIFCSLAFMACQGSKVTITLDPNGGSGGTATITPEYGKLMPEAVAPTKKGYDFKGYFNALDGGTMYYKSTMDAARTWQNEDITTLYAHWETSNYNVYLNTQGGTGGTDRVIATTGLPMPIASAPVRVGYAFMGYYDAIVEGEMYYNANMESQKIWDKAPDEKISYLYARWNSIIFKLTFDKQGGTGGDTEIDVIVDKEMPEGITAPTKTGNTFMGYFSLPNGAGVKYYDRSMKSAETWTQGQDGKVYAYWVPFTNGTGTEANPFKINNKSMMTTLAEEAGDFAGMYFELTADISFGGDQITPIGIKSPNGFAGNFDGKDYTVRGFKLVGNSSDKNLYSGLFATNNGSIQNLTINDYIIRDNYAITNSKDEGYMFVGGLVAYNRGEIKNCTAKGGLIDVTVTNIYAGLLVGESLIGSITNCKAEPSGTGDHITVTASSAMVGGLIGDNISTNISNCHATANINVVGDGTGVVVYIGGLIGQNRNSNVSSSYATGDIVVNAQGSNRTLANVGGFMGSSSRLASAGLGCEITDCYAKGDVTVTIAELGIYDYGDVENTDKVVDQCVAGGFSGHDQFSTISNCYSSGNVTATSGGFNEMYTGGYIGRLEKSTLTNCLVIGDLNAYYENGHTFYGRLVGIDDDSTINNTYYYVDQISEPHRGAKGELTLELIESGGGASATRTQIESSTFFTSTLKWNSTVWRFSNLSLTQKNLPTLA